MFKLFFLDKSKTKDILEHKLLGIKLAKFEFTLFSLYSKDFSATKLFNLFQITIH